MHGAVRSESQPTEVQTCTFGTVWSGNLYLRKLIGKDMIRYWLTWPRCRDYQALKGIVVPVIEHSDVAFFENCPRVAGYEQITETAVFWYNVFNGRSRPRLVVDTLMKITNNSFWCEQEARVWQRIAGRPRRRLRNAEKSGVDQQASLCDYTLATTYCHLFILP